MITSHTTAPANQSPSALETASDNSRSCVDTLIILPREPRITRAISAAFSDESAVLLQLPHGGWDVNLVSEAIEPALQQHTMKHLILVGHSLMDNSEAASSLDSSLASGTLASRRGNNRLLAGVQSFQHQSQAAQQRLVKRVAQLTDIAAVREQSSNAGLQVHGLFYRTESGIFLIYDVKTQSFHPLFA